jgi:hypothetical protein
MNLIEQLNHQAEEIQSRAETISKYIDIFTEVTNKLPKSFSVPDDMYIKAPELVFDIILSYYLAEGEQDETLRKVLGMTFGLTRWTGSIDSKTKLFTLVATGSFLDYSIMITISGADLHHYQLAEKPVIENEVVCNQFLPWIISRKDTPANLWKLKLLELKNAKRQLIKYVKLLNKLEEILPKQLPQANGLTFLQTPDYGLDITYLNDLKGKKRQSLDKYLGYVGWVASFEKKTAIFSLHTLVLHPELSSKIKVSVTINNACLSKEKLFILEENREIIAYKAIRKTDPDYSEVCKRFRKAQNEF